jgi:predicted outer membrane repeat protein
MRQLFHPSVSRSLSNQSKQKRKQSRQRIAMAIETLEARRLLTNVYNVTGFADGAGTVAGSGPFTATTLRAAINAADVATGSSTINLPAGTYTLNSSSLGSLSVTADMTISGAGAATTIINAAGLDSSAFSVVGSSGGSSLSTISGVTIENASPSASSLGGSGVSFSGEGPNAVLDLTNDVIEKNTGGWIDALVTEGAGGGIYDSGGVVNVTGCTIAGNSAISTGTGSGGGGVYANFGDVNVLASTISGNSATDGGAIYANTAGHLSVSNSTIAANTATIGGAIYLFDSGLFLASDTIAFNTATSSGGGIVSTQPLPITSGDSIQDSIVAENTVAGTEDDFDAPTGLGEFTSAGYNLIGVANGDFTAFTGDQTGTADTPLNPDFTSTTIQNNGGPTFTLLPGTGSPVIDKGSNVLAVNNDIAPAFFLSTDQIGNQRIVNGTVDIGAVEVQAAPAANNLVVENTNPSGDGSLAAAVSAANSSASPSFITFDPAVFTTPQTITLGGSDLELTNTSEPTTITGPAAGITISGGGSSRVFVVETSVTAEIDDVTITGGGASSVGGISDNGTLTLTNDIVSHNHSTVGGALYVEGQLTATNTTFDSNTSSGTGGVMFEDGENSESTFNGCTFSNNSTTDVGGALAIGADSPPTVTVLNSTFAGNTAKGDGGAIYLGDGSLTIQDSTLSDNTTFESHGAGGAIGVGGPGNTNPIVLTGDIIAGNFYNDGNGNTSSDDISTQATSTNGFPVTGSYNLIGTGGSGGLVDSTNHNQVGVANPGLAPLGNNGGPTQTMALIAGSPAISKGVAINGISADQRGVSRTGGVPIDIGAYQYSTPATVTIAAGDVNGLITYLSPDATTTINLTKSNYDFTQVNNNWYGPDALPPIQSKVTINGNGATLQRDPSLPQTTAGAMRFFYVSGGIPTELPLGTLTLKNLTLTNGLAKGGESDLGGAGMGAGGAIFNQGNLTLNGVTLTGNAAMGGNTGLLDRIGNGGGIGQDASSEAGGGFGGSFPKGIYGGAGNNAGGGGFDAGGQSVDGGSGDTGGGFSGLGGWEAGQGFGGDGGSNEVDSTSAIGGDFGFGGAFSTLVGGGGGGAGGVGGGGSIAGRRLRRRGWGRRNC